MGASGQVGRSEGARTKELRPRVLQRTTRPALCNGAGFFVFGRLCRLLLCKTMLCHVMPCHASVWSGLECSHRNVGRDTTPSALSSRFAPLSPSMPSQRGHKERNLLGGRDTACLAVRRMWLCAVDLTCRVVGQTGTTHRVLSNHRITADHFGEKTSHGGKIKVACVIVEQLPR